MIYTVNNGAGTEEREFDGTRTPATGYGGGGSETNQGECTARGKSARTQFWLSRGAKGETTECNNGWCNSKGFGLG